MTSTKKAARASAAYKFNAQYQIAPGTDPEQLRDDADQFTTWARELLRLVAQEIDDERIWCVLGLLEMADGVESALLDLVAPRKGGAE